MEKQFDFEDLVPNTAGRHEITCPECNYEFGNSWENSSDAGMQKCKCGAFFTWTRSTSISYDSVSLAPEEESNFPNHQ